MQEKISIKYPTTATNLQPAESRTPTRSIDWRRLIELALLLALVVAALYLVSRVVTPQVVQIMSVIVGFLLLRFVVRTVLQVTFTILGFLFWLAIFVAILICIL